MILTIFSSNFHQWKQEIKDFRVDGVPVEQMRKIRAILVSGSSSWGRVINGIVTHLFGIERLKVTLFSPKNRESFRQKDRKSIFSKDDENQLKGKLLIILTFHSN